MPDQETLLSCLTTRVADGPLVSSQGAILFSALSAAIFVVITLWVQSKIAKKRATLDMLIKKEWDKDYIESKQKFNQLRKNLVEWADEEKQNSDTATMIRNILNDYEMIAIGIKHGILDEKVYRKWFKTTLLKDYESSDAFISEIRRQQKNPHILCEFEHLAEKWGASHHRPNKRAWWRQWRR